MELACSTIVHAIPIALAALGGVIAERAGVINFALEGMMLSGAFAAVWASHVTGSPYVGLLAAIVAGVAIALCHAFASIALRVNQVLSAIAVNLLSLGLSGACLWHIFGQGTSPNVASLPGVAVAGYTWNVLVPLTVVAAFALQAFLKFTRAGLHLRATGEDVEIARSAGVNVTRVKFTAVCVSGAFAGAAGAYLSIGLLSSFTLGMTNGRGYIAVAAVIFGKWDPLGALAASTLFGFFAAAGGALGVGTLLPPEFFQALPYILTILSLAVFVGKSRPPAALGRLSEAA
jgi:ABC-type uncharacterized transport system permease subunit